MKLSPYNVFLNRYKILRNILVLIFFFYLLYMGYLQIFDPFMLAAKNKGRYREKKIMKDPYRGNIYDRNGVELAKTKTVYQLDIDYRNLENRSKNKKRIKKYVIDQIIDNLYSKQKENKQIKKVKRKLVYKNIKNKKNYIIRIPIDSKQKEYISQIKNKKLKNIFKISQMEGEVYITLDDYNSYCDYLSNNLLDINLDKILNVVLTEINKKDKIKSIKKRIKNTKSRTIMLSDKISNTNLHTIKKALEKDDLYDNYLIETKLLNKRIYIYDDILLRVLGRCTYPDYSDDEKQIKSNSIDQLRGENGLEKYLDKYLIGRYGWENQMLNAYGEPIRYSHLAEQEALDGNNVYLTIDMEIQKIVEKQLRKDLQKYNAERAMAVFMNINTGEILAMASVKKSDIKKNKYSFNKLRAENNFVLSEGLEPGSTIKPITILLSLEKKLFDQDEKINCKPYIYVKGGKRRVISDVHSFNKLSFKDVLVFSSNPGISRIVDKIGKDDLYKKFRQLGLGENLSVFGTKPENIKLFKDDNDSFQLHSWSFGHGMTATALQLTNMYATFANGGSVLKPQIIKKISNYDNSKTIIESKKRIVRDLYAKLEDKKNLETLNMFLKETVDKGTAKNVKLDIMPIGGKTGTAEISEGGKYTKKNYTSFCGFFPVKNPEIAGTVIFYDPKNDFRFGGTSACPTMRNIIKEFLSLNSYQELAKRGINENSVFVKVPNLVGESLSQAKKILKNKNLNYEIKQFNGKKITNQYPKAGDEVVENYKISLEIGGKKEIMDFDEDKMPDVVGAPIRKAFNLLVRKYGLNIEIVGTGKIYSQSIKPGSKIEVGELCVLKAKR